MPSVATNLLSIRADDIEAVAFRNRGAPAGIADVQAFRRALRTSEVAASNGKYTRSDLTWHVPVLNLAGDAQLGTTEPIPGAVITDPNGHRWTVLDQSLETRNSRWRFITRNLAIFWGLNSSVTIQKARQVKQPAGDFQRQWFDWLPGQKARIQLQGTAQGVNHDMRLSAFEYRIFLEQEPPEPLTGENHRIVAGGETYKILRFDSPAMITDLYEVTAQSIPFPNAS